MTDENDNQLSFEVGRLDLLKALQIAEQIAPTRNASDILTNVHLSVGNDKIVVSATDSTIGVFSIIRKVNIINEGELLLPAAKKTLSAILGKSKSPTVKIALKKTENSGLINITLLDGKYRINLYNFSNFPMLMEHPESNNAITLPASAFDDCLKRTVFAVDSERKTSALNGVRITLEEDKLFFAATDGKVLSEVSIQNESYKEKELTPGIIPEDAVSQISKILSQNEEAEATLLFAKNNAFLKTVISNQGNTDSAIQVELSTRIIEGNFPPYRNIIPPTSTETITFDTKQLVEVIERTILLSAAEQDGNFGVLINITEGDDDIVFTNFSKSSGDVDIIMTTKHSVTESKSIGFNAKYLINIAKSFKNNEVILEINGRGKGIVMKDQQAIYLIMPIGVKDK